jgi:hypothetical protein
MNFASTDTSSRTSSKTRVSLAMVFTLFAGIGGGVFGSILATGPAHPPVLITASTSSSSSSSAAKPVAIEPGTPILLLDKGVARASVRVDRNGLILLNFTTPTGQNRIALGVLGDDHIALGVFDGTGKARAGMEVPMSSTSRVQLLLEKQPLKPANGHSA